MPVRRRIPWWGWVLGVVAAVVGTVAAVGGFNDVPVQSLPRIELGETYSTNAVDVTVLSAELSDGSAFHNYMEEGMQYVTVEVDVTATTDEPSFFTRQLIRVLLEGVIAPDDANLDVDLTELRNGGSGGTIQPGLPTRFAYSWKVDAGSAQVGDEIIIGIFEEYDAPDDPRFDDAKTAPVPVVRIVTELGAGP